jgi:hypothetical protein
MRKSLIAILGVTVLLVSLTAIAHAQTTQTTTVTKVQAVQNPDGTYTIVEYPVGKETVVTLNPVGITGATGTATILRDANGSTIKIKMTNLPAEVAALNLYVVDPTGAVTTLGPLEIANGVGTFTTTTPMTRFMLLASPDANLTAYDANTKIFFRSAVPTGFAVIPISKDKAVGEQVAATAAVPVTAEPVTTAPVTTPPVTTPPVTTPTVTTPPVTTPPVTTPPVTTPPVTTPPVTTPPVTAAPVTAAPVTAAPVTAAPVTAETVAAPVVAADYTVPMLGVPGFKAGDEKKLKVEFAGAMEGARANVFIEPHKGGKMTEVRMQFHDLKEAPKGLAYILWAVSPDNQFQRLGSIVNVRGRNEAEIKSETALEDFGLLLTTEDVGIPAATLVKPGGSRVGIITIIK